MASQATAIARTDSPCVNATYVTFFAEVGRDVSNEREIPTGKPWASRPAEGTDGVLELVDGVTRATRVAKLLPGTTIRVEVIGKLRRPHAQSRRIRASL